MIVVLRPLVVLLVEDDLPTRDMYRSALRAAGYAVTAVEDGIDALRYVEQHRPHAVVLDLALPRVGGRDVRRELRGRSDTCNLPIIIVTGSDASDIQTDDRERLLPKPVDPETLVRETDRAIARARPKGAPAGC